MWTFEEMVEAFDSKVGVLASLVSSDEKVRWWNEGQARLGFYRPLTVDLAWAEGDRSITLPTDFLSVDKLIFDDGVCPVAWWPFGKTLKLDDPEGAPEAGSARLHYWAEWPEMTTETEPYWQHGQYGGTLLGDWTRSESITPIQVPEALLVPLDFDDEYADRLAGGYTMQARVVGSWYRLDTLRVGWAGDLGPNATVIANRPGGRTSNWLMAGETWDTGWVNVSLTGTPLQKKVSLYAAGNWFPGYTVHGGTALSIRWTLDLTDLEDHYEPVFRSELTWAQDYACLYYSLHRFYRRLASNRNLYTRYATLVGRNAIAPEDLQNESERYRQDFIETRDEHRRITPAFAYGGS